jgi:hypothetical protein
MLVASIASGLTNIFEQWPHRAKQHSREARAAAPAFDYSHLGANGSTYSRTWSPWSW